MAIQTINPANGDVIKTYQPMDDSAVEKALSGAVLAYEIHKKRQFSERAALMMRAAEVLEAEKEAFATLMTQEMGKTVSSARAEIEKCALVCRYYAENAEKLLQDRPVVTEHSEAYVRYLPLGPILAVMPWNFPFWQVFRFAAPALMAGNVGLLKHASNVPACALAIEGVFRKAGFEEGCFQTLLIESDKVAGIISDPRVKAITLTGSEAAGSQVAAQAGKYLKKSVLELGGSDPFIVMPSADFDLAVQTAVKGRVQNNGQTCIAAKRFIVHQDIYENFKAAVVEKFETLTVGDPMADGVDVGPLATAKIRAELDAQVQETIAQGAVRLTGAKILGGAGNYYQPGLLENIPKDSSAYKDELFGPVGLLFRVKDLDEAIALANDTRFGLASVIFTQDKAEMVRAIDGIEAGVTFVNAMVSSDPRLPFGGVKSSGFGRELAEDGLREFTNIKTVIVR